MYRLILLAAVLSWSASVSAELTGKVVRIADGDSFTLLTPDKRQVKIRLAEIDAPERGQPYGNRARQKLSQLVFQTQVRVEVQTTDRYGRTVGRPYVGDLDVCAEMVRSGAAWAYRRYVRDSDLLTLEQEAREARRGLWSLPEADKQPPWEWRRSSRPEQGPNGCSIKGNIASDGDKIYHLPSMASYGPTKINEAKGERWFCSEEEAQAAGWRAPR
ncbi:thermonuclease family protein [Lentisalinibacter salinarum]|uniref:thermonuclease family protein n=1 Tax=Lentisalinibacter salinarum TaxID=2992239 RepID=UPI00386D5760